MGRHMGSRKWLECSNCHRKLFLATVNETYGHTGLKVILVCYRCDKQIILTIGIISKEEKSRNE